MNEKRGSSKKKTTPIIIALSVLLLLAVIVIGLLLAKNGKCSEETNSTETGTVEKLTDSINLPGYGSLYLEADTTKQHLALPNPEQNVCWIRITIALEDGTVLWTSGLIAPGETSEPMELSQPLAKGTYSNAMLQYECFADEAGTQALNGAEVNLDLFLN